MESVQKQNDATRKAIDSILTGKTHYSTPFERLGYRPINLLS